MEPEIEYLEDIAVEFRQKMVKNCLNLGFINLAKVAADTMDPEEVASAGELDLLNMGCTPAQASSGVVAGSIVHQLVSVLYHLGNASLSPDIDDNN